MRRKFICAHNPHGVVPFLMDLNQTDAVFGELPNQIVIVRGRAYGHFIWVLTKIVYHLAGDIIVYVHPPQA